MAEKERYMAIFIGAILIFSMAGFAFTSSILRTPAVQQVQIPNIIERPLKPEEVVFVLRTGRVLVRNYYSEEQPYLNILDNFADKFKDYIVFEKVSVAENETERFEMIGRTGEIKDLGNETISEETLMDIFCDYAILQPKECLMREI